MSVNLQVTTKGSLVENEKWCRLAYCIVIHVKKALLGVLHNSINHQNITPLPSDPIDLYNEMIKRKGKLKNLKQDDLLLLLPNDKKVFSDKLDITMLRFLIRTFCSILNEDRNWNKPRDEDRSIAAAVFRAASIRNEVLHHGNPESIQDEEFETKWSKIEDILADLQYIEDISYMKNGVFDPSRVNSLHSNMTKDFENILVAYKDKCKNEKKDEWSTFIGRRYKNVSTNHIVTDIDAILRDHDSVMVSGEAGLGKTFSAKNVRYLWALDVILKSKQLIYIDSKNVSKNEYKKSYRAPIHISELQNMTKNKTDEYLESFNCVTKAIQNIIILIDGVDELDIEENKLNLNYLKDLKIKIENNEKITSMETIMGIYFGMLFPGSKMIVFGRKSEINRLKEIDDKSEQSTLFNKQTRAHLELQPFQEDDVKELISRVNCDVSSCSCMKCTKTYNFVKDVEFRNIPSHLMALIRIFEYLPNPNFGRMTKTKIFIITIFNLLKNHTQTVFLKDVKTFKKLLAFDKAKEFRECIQNIAKMSIFSLLDNNVTIKVEAYNENDVDYFKYEQTVQGYNICVKIKRDILEQLDFFYIRDLDYHVILEPYHLTNMEFLSSCYIYCHPDEWNLLLPPYLNEDSQTIILPYVAGLYSNENFTKDFVSEFLQNTSNGDVETYLSWLFSVEDVRNCLPFSSWHGLKENGDVFPSFDLLHRINEEVDVFDNISRRLNEVKTLVCYCSYDFEWYNMEEFKHKFLTNSVNKCNVKSFMSKFENYQIIVKETIKITTKEQFDLLMEMLDNDKIKFRIYCLHFDYNTQYSTHVTKHLKCNVLTIGLECGSRAIDFLSNVSFFSTATTSNRIPIIEFNQLFISNISHFNAQQTKKLFALGLSDVVDSIALFSPFFTDGQLAILEDVERKAHKLINIELLSVKFHDMLRLPNLGNRHVYLINVDDVTDNDLIEFKKHIPPGYSDNFAYYKIITQTVPFVRKENYSRDVEHSMFLNLYRVDFTKVSPEVFAKTFSMISSLSCCDNDYIPSLHWSRLSQIEDCRINEMRIWKPRPENFEHFFKLKTNILQFICNDISFFQQLLNYIANIELDKQIKVFVVKSDLYDWDFYEEVTLFSGKTVGNYEYIHSSYDKLLDNIGRTFHEGDANKLWCCEISQSFQKNTDVAEIEDSGKNCCCLF